MLKLAVPTVAAQLINMLYNIVDRIYIGHIPEVGSTALTGVGVTFPIITLVSAFAAFAGQGGAPLASIQLGAGRRDEAERILGNSLVLLLAASLLLTVGFSMYKEPILYAFGASDATIGYAVDYIRIYLLGTIFVQLALGLNSFISAQGKALVAMLSVLIGAILNIVLDPIFIFLLDWGVQGAALATILSQAVSACWVFGFLCSRHSGLRIRRSNLRPSARVIGRIASLGVAPFIMQSTESLVTVVLNTGLQTYGGDLYVGALTIMQSVMQMIVMPVQGITQGTQPIMSYNYGAGKPERVKKTFFLILAFSFGFTTIASWLILLFPKTFIMPFTDSQRLIEITIPAIRIYFGGMMFIGVLYACQRTFMALGRTKLSLLGAMMRKLVILLPLCFILPRLGYGTDGLLYAECIADVLGSAIVFAIFIWNFKSMLNPS